MIKSGLGAGFIARFGQTAFQNALERGGQSNTDRTRIGSTPIRKDIQGVSEAKLNPGRTSNPSQNSRISAEGARAATGVSNPTSDQQFAFNETDELGPAHYHDQYLGQSIRAPMATKGKPSRGDESKNIFFRFAGEENADKPGIWMFINPQQLSINMSKKLPQQVTRGGHVIFHWGDNLDEISASAITGSFARPDCSKSDASSHHGEKRYTGSEPDFGRPHKQLGSNDGPTARQCGG